MVPSLLRNCQTQGFGLWFSVASESLFAGNSAQLKWNSCILHQGRQSGLSFLKHPEQGEWVRLACSLDRPVIAPFFGLHAIYWQMPNNVSAGDCGTATVTAPWLLLRDRPRWISSRVFQTGGGMNRWWVEITTQSIMSAFKEQNQVGANEKKKSEFIVHRKCENSFMKLKFELYMCMCVYVCCSLL